MVQQRSVVYGRLWDHGHGVTRKLGVGDVWVGGGDVDHGGGGGVGSDDVGVGGGGQHGVEERGGGGLDGGEGGNKNHLERA